VADGAGAPLLQVGDDVHLFLELRLPGLELLDLAISFFRRSMSALAFTMSASSLEIFPETVVWK